MKVSIITATFNSEFSILDCINSVYNQTYEDVDHIIIDGKSTDETVNLILNNKNRVKLLISEIDNGIYDAMNKGIAEANGDIIGILNSDDVFFNNDVLNNIVLFFKKNLEIDAVYGNLVYVKRNNLNKIVRYWKSFDYYPKFFENGNVPPHPTLFVRKRVYLEHGKFNTLFRLSADYEFMLRILKVKSVNSKHINFTMVKMRLGGATSKNISNIIKQNIEIFDAWKLNKVLMPYNFYFVKLLKRIRQYFL
jgi:glycosyltransferase involved in cell wall biosynthesis